MSFENIHLGNAMTGFSTSPNFAPYTRVVVKVDGDHSYAAGDESGRTLEVDCPFGNQTMANSLLTQVQNYSYQPYEATGAAINPAAELGDGITAKGVYSGVYKVKADFNHAMPWTVSAESDEELEHELGYKDSNGKFVTYAGLRRGTTAVNGAGLMSNSVENASIATNAILNRNIASGQIYTTTCDETINSYFADIIAANKIFAGSAYAKFMLAEQFGVHSGSAYGGIVARRLWVDSSGVVHAT